MQSIAKAMAMKNIKSIPRKEVLIHENAWLASMVNEMAHQLLKSKVKETQPPPVRFVSPEVDRVFQNPNSARSGMKSPR